VNNQFYQGNCYFSEPAVVDLNKDGTEDLIYSSGYSKIQAINGRSGKQMYEYSYPNPTDLSLLGRDKPLISSVNKNLVVWLPVKTDKGYDMIGLNSKGEERYRKSLPKSELLSTSYNSSFGDCGFDNGYLDLNTFKFTSYKWNKIVKEQYYSNLDYNVGRYSDNKVKFNGELCNVITYEFVSGTNSVLAIVGENSGAVHFKQVLAGRSEFIPVVEDVDKDGKVDLLVNTSDGMLYCYSLGVNVKELVKR
jgi:hypothetical protein